MKASVLTLALVGLTTAQLFPNQSPLNHSCVIQKHALSCSKQAQDPSLDSCCTEVYGGLLVSTQFWSTYTGLESEGQLLPPSHWGLHGLWPDFCNGSYTQYCDLTRQYDPDPSPNTTNGLPSGTPVPPYKGPPVTTFFEAFGRLDLLNWANTYWINQGQPNWWLWGHEFSKHATCFSVFDVPCYGPQYVEHEDVINFFDTVIKYFLRLPTYDWLKAAGITPSNSTSYSLSDFQNTLTSAYGTVPYVGCAGPRFNETKAGKGTMDNGRTALSEVWYFSWANGRAQDQTEQSEVKVNSTSKSNCATSKGAVWYYERTPGSERS